MPDDLHAQPTADVAEAELASEGIAPSENRSSPFVPLRQPIFRAVWFASLASNFGGLVQAVGASWMMASISPSAEMVALVQASTTLPVMLFSLAAGAISDNYDRRRIMLTAQGFMLTVSVGLAAFTKLGLITPWLLLCFTFLIGCGTALNNPAWQSSVGDMVPRRDVPAAVTLNSVAFNIARSVGPAIGGAIVAAAGAVAAFVINAFSYIGLITVLARWQPPRIERVLPRETLFIAMGAGVRYVAMSPNIRAVILRAFAFGFGAIVGLALLPLVARDLIRGGPLTYGILLGAGALDLHRLCGRHPGGGVQPHDLDDHAGPVHLRRLLGSGAVDLQCHGAALRAALGRGTGTGDLPDGDLRGHGAGKLGLGPHRPALRH